MPVFGNSSSSGSSSSAGAGTGTNGQAIPTTSVLEAFSNSSGNLTPVSPTNPLPVALYSTSPGADQTNNTQGVTQLVVISAVYSAKVFFMASAADCPLKNAKGSQGQLLAIDATNMGATAVWLQILDTAAITGTGGPVSGAPGTGTVPLRSWLLPAGTANNPGGLDYNRDDFGLNGIHFNNGLTIAISATQFTYTTPTTSNITGYATTNYNFGGTYA